MTFLSSTRKFLKAADWLTDADAPAREGLLAAAKELDKRMQPTLLSQYRLLHKQLLDGKSPKSPDDEDDDLLTPGGN